MASHVLVRIDGDVTDLSSQSRVHLQNLVIVVDGGKGTGAFSTREVIEGFDIVRGDVCKAVEPTEVFHGIHGNMFALLGGCNDGFLCNLLSHEVYEACLGGILLQDFTVLLLLCVVCANVKVDVPDSQFLAILDHRFHYMPEDGNLCP